MSSFTLAGPLARHLSVLALCTVFIAVSLVWAGSQKAGSAINTRSNVFDQGRVSPQGNTITVNSLQDGSLSTDGLCTLRDAIFSANNNTASGSAPGECAAGSGSGADTIIFSVTGTINLGGVLPDITSDMTITGPGSSQLTVKRNTSGLYRIFNITSGTVSLSGLTITNGQLGNTPPNSGGGGIQNLGTLTMNDVVVTANGAGLGSFLGGSPGGGGIYNQGTLTLTNCSITGNSTADSPDNSTRPSHGGGIDNRATMTMTDCVVSNNKTGNGVDIGGWGGGIYTAGPTSITRTTISNNVTGNSSNSLGGHGGGVFNTNILTLVDSTISGNSTGATSSGASTGLGGAIDNENGLTLAGCTISGNTGAAGAILSRNGVVARNTTISGNHSAGINSSDSGSIMRMTNMTVTANDGTGLIGPGSPSSLLRNSIVAGNGGGNDVTGQFSSQGHNLIGATSSAFFDGVNGDQVGSTGSPLDPHLGPLANNGGPTQTHALLSNSTALDAGDDCVTQVSHCGDASVPQLITDQRGFSRIVDGDFNGTVVTDIGAFESQFAVTNSNDSGAGSLRQAITDASAVSGTPTIGIGIPASDPGCAAGVCTITLTGGELVINHNMNISGPGANLLTVSGNNASRIFNLQSGQVSISGITMANGKVFAVDPNGGPGLLNSGGNLTLTGCAVSNNVAQAAGGGITTTGGTTNINQCLIGNNNGQSGGGIAVRGGTVNINNTTVSGNTAAGMGGGVFQDLGSMTFTNVTITNNRTTGGDGGGYRLVPAGVATFNNSIVAGNFNGASPSTNPDDITAIVGGSFNIIGAGGSGLTNGVNGNQVGITNPGLAPLANNGGPTQTHALLASSPALDAGSNTIATNAGLTTDQRGSGFTRSVDGPDADATATVDIGAFEAQIFVENIADLAINEEAQLQFSFSVGGTITSVTASSSNTALVPNNSANINLTGSGSARTLTINPVANLIGTSTITVTVNGSGGQSMTDTFVLTVNAVNDAPSFVKGADQTVNEDAGPQSVSNWATSLSPGGGADESGQTLTFQVTNNTNASLFSAGPAISSGGTLTYTPAANANGSATITINLKDSGGTANGGVDTSASQTFNITVSPINDAPSFTKGADQTVNEDAGAQTVSWATAISAGPNESSQTLTFQITNNSNASLFSAGPAVSSTGTLTYTPAANANGSATITINLKDNGGTTNGGVDTSAAQTFVINVTSVNDAPSFTKGPNPTANEDSGAQTVANWATAMSAGPADESSQTLTFQIVGNGNPSIFSVAPAVSANGTLTFTPAANANGSSVITINLKDSGGTANGGADTSASQTFTIFVTPVNDAPSFTKGTDRTVNNNAGAQTVTNWATNITAGPGDESSQTLTFQVTGNTNPGLFTAGPAISSTGTLTYTPSSSAGGTATITINLKDNGGTANGGVDTSPSQTFTITVTPVGGFVNFASSSSNTTENSGSTTIIVTRSGDTSRAVTVNYATNADAGVPCSTANGVASPKCDFTAALGSVSFAAGETGQAVTILLSQDSFVEGPETITLTLSNPTGGAALGTTSSMAVTIADDATEPPTNIIDDANMFVRMHYHDFLNREGDQSGIGFWTGQMSNCGSSDLTVCRVNVSGAFFLSIEFQQTGYLVERMYRTAYGQATATSTLGGSHAVLVPIVRANEFLTDTQRIGRGVVVLQPGWETVLENNKQAYALEFVQTSRFITALPTSRTPTQFVDQLNQNAGMVLSASERTAAINTFGIAADTTNVNARAKVLRQIAEDQDLYNAEFNRAFVLAQYIGYLRRNPNDAPESSLDYTGYEFWLNKLVENGGDYVKAEMVKAFISSGEYRQRFGP